MVVDIYNTNKKYNIIYADPPWRYTGWRKGNRSVERHYSTMKVDEIIDMKDTIKSITDENCVLFLWVTFPCLIEGLKVMKEWGFKYKTCGFTWVKRNNVADTWFFGLGSWTFNEKRNGYEFRKELGRSNDVPKFIKVEIL